MALFETVLTFIVVIGLVLIGTIPVFKRFNVEFSARLASWLRGRGLFSETDISSEYHRIDLLRIAIGLLVAAHYGSELYSTVLFGEMSDAVMVSVVVALALMIMVGFLTPVASAALLLLMNTIFPSVTSTLSIGTMVIGMCMLPMVISPAGHTLSIDSALMRWKPVAWIYRLWGAPSLDRSQLGCFLALLAFSSINLYSGLNHLGSETWRSGLATGTILLFETSNKNYYQTASWVYEHAPWFYIALSFITTWGMLIWQLLLLPLVLLSKWTRIVVMIWAACFFVASAHVLSIKMLGVYEYVLFALIFWSSWMILPKRAIKVLFDDRCNLCGKTVKTIGALDVFRRIDFRPLSQNLAFAHQHGVSEQEALTDLVGVDDNGKIYRGYDLYIRLSAIVLLMLPAWPILFLGKITRIGPMVYRFIAVRRRELFGVCELGTYRPRKDWTPLAAPARPSIANGMIIGFAILLVPFLTTLPQIGPMLGETGVKINRAFAQSAPYSVFGVGPINVFNELDLKIYRSHVHFTTFDQAVEKPVTVRLSELDQARLTQFLRVAALGPVYCSPDFAKAMIQRLGLTLAKDDPRRQFDATAVFRVASHPNADDFYSFKYSPVTYEEVCRVVGKVDGEPDTITVDYTPTYLNLLSAQLSEGDKG